MAARSLPRGLPSQGPFISLVLWEGLRALCAGAGTLLHSDMLWPLVPIPEDAVGWVLVPLTPPCTQPKQPTVPLCTGARGSGAGQALWHGVGSAWPGQQQCRCHGTAAATVPGPRCCAGDLPAMIPGTRRSNGCPERWCVISEVFEIRDLPHLPCRAASRGPPAAQRASSQPGTPG